ncbi:MAG: SDR family oxidoreductase [Deltaproteobacteria bacterium]|nr:MAG: SDR family oxidoreductase [Deltaproteobacteria bacterium]TMQ24095.1 MAG: SDR family oxidoreductase [Deltaproteobacteria bacterium]
MSMLCEGRVALVTGGSRGLGRAICLALAREGAIVAFNYLKADADADATVALIEAAGGRASAHKVSVLDKPGLAELVRSLDRGHGKIDILVNNAGYGQVVPLALMEESDWDEMLDTHVKGAFLTTQAVLRIMVRERFGRVINVSSLAGIKMMQAPVHYATAKAALKGFTESLAKEVGRYGITVNCVAPGILDEGVSDHLPPARREEYLRHCALRRVGRLDEAADMIAFLASDRASYTNGATLVVDGAV